MNGSTSPSKADDTLPLLFGVAAGALLLLSCTLAGVIGVLLPLVILRLWERPVFIVITLGIGLSLTAIGYVFGAFALLFEAVFELVPNTLRSSDPWALALLWLRFAMWWPAWLTLLPIGVIVGAFFALAAVQRHQHLTFQQLSDKRALLASFLHTRIAKLSKHKKNQTIIGTDFVSGATEVMPAADKSPHTMIVGVSGSGKTVSLCNIIESEISSGNGLVFIDGKGDSDLCSRIIDFCNTQNRNYHIIDMTRTVKSSAYNPLSDGDATSLADRLMTMRPWTEPHYESLSTGFIQTAFKVMRTVNAPLDLLTAAEALDPKYLLSLLRRNARSGQKLQPLAREVSNMRKQDDSVSGIRADLNNLSNSTFRPLFDTVEAQRHRQKILSLLSSRQKNDVVIISLPSLTYPKFSAAMGRLIINDLKYAISKSNDKWTIVLDEFSVFSGPQVLNIINQGRGFGINLTIAIQSLSDIKLGVTSNGDAFLNQVIGSIGNYIIHRVNSSDDADILAGLIGTRASLKKTRQIDNNLATGKESERETREFYIHPDELKNIPNYHAVLVRKNVKLTQRISVRKSNI